MTTKAPPDIVPVAMHQQRPPQKLELSEGEVTGLGGGGALVTHDAQPDVGLLNQSIVISGIIFLNNLTWSMDTSFPPSPMAAVRFAGSHSAMDVSKVMNMFFFHSDSF